MKTRKKISQTTTPNGRSLILCQHDSEYYMHVDGHELMSSRRNESELELGRIACQELAETTGSPVQILIGGLGMGYTLRAALDALPPTAEVVIAELLSDVTIWNRDIIGHLADHPLKDQRVSLHNRDVLELFKEYPDTFDAILLDIDNGPEAFTDSANDKLYSEAGIQAILHALRRHGSIYFWSAGFDRNFEKRLEQSKLVAKSIKVKAHKNARKRSHCIVVASRFNPN